MEKLFTLTVYRDEETGVFLGYRGSKKVIPFVIAAISGELPKEGEAAAAKTVRWLLHVFMDNPEDMKEFSCLLGKALMAASIPAFPLKGREGKEGSACRRAN